MLSVTDISLWQRARELASHHEGGVNKHSKRRLRISQHWEQANSPGTWLTMAHSVSVQNVLCNLEGWKVPSKAVPAGQRQHPRQEAGFPQAGEASPKEGLGCAPQHWQKRQAPTKEAQQCNTHTREDEEQQAEWQAAVKWDTKACFKAVRRR
jgi:hypothetical protein